MARTLQFDPGLNLTIRGYCVRAAVPWYRKR
jgi:hypothetical protein